MNEFVTMQTIARAVLPRLEEKLVAPNLMYKDFSDTYASQGDTIQIRKPVKLEAKAFDAAAGVSYQDIKEQSETIKLDNIATVDVEASAIETALNIDDLNRVFVEPAAAALAEKINRDGLALYKDIPTFVGTAGTTPKELKDLANIRKQLNKQKAPTAGRVAIFDPEADAMFSTVPAIVNAEKSGTTEALREGAIGRVMGLDTYMSQGIAQHKAGTAQAGTIKVNGATAKGATKISLDGLTTAAGKTAVGDLIKIGNYSYTITGVVTAASNALTDVPIFPALQADVADNADVTYVGDHTANLAFAPMAFAFVTRPLVNPDGQGVQSYVTSYNGISLRVTKGYDMAHKKSTYSVDVLYAYKTIYPELACRVLG